MHSIPTSIFHLRSHRPTNSPPSPKMSLRLTWPPLQGEPRARVPRRACHLQLSLSAATSRCTSRPWQSSRARATRFDTILPDSHERIQSTGDSQPSLGAFLTAPRSSIFEHRTMEDVRWHLQKSMIRVYMGSLSGLVCEVTVERNPDAPLK